jgi:hypothetical protein
VSPQTERALLFVVIVGAFVLNVTGVISSWLGLAVQACAVSFAIGVTTQAGRSSRQSITIATHVTESFIADADAALREGVVPDEERDDVETQLACAHEALALLDSMAGRRERRRRRRARARAESNHKEPTR